MRKAALLGLAIAVVVLWLLTTFVSGLEDLRWLRYTLMAILGVFEIGIIIGMYRVIFSAKSDAETKERLAAQGLPKPIAKLVAWEARFWRRVLRRPRA